MLCITLMPSLPWFTLRLQVCVAVLLDNFVNASARDEEKERLRKIEEAKSFKVREEWGKRGIQPTRKDKVVT